MRWLMPIFSLVLCWACFGQVPLFYLSWTNTGDWYVVYWAQNYLPVPNYIMVSGNPVPFISCYQPSNWQPFCVTDQNKVPIQAVGDIGYFQVWGYDLTNTYPVQVKISQQ